MEFLGLYTEIILYFYVYCIMKKLKVAILWHQHQPYYKYKNEFLLPWVRLHGVKDYYDLPALMNEYPSVKQTINLVPSLMIQIDDYINNITSDRIQRLTRIPARHLTDKDKSEILDNFFTINYDNLVKPNERYNELFNICNNKKDALQNLQTHDWLDLQVWYNLAWIGQISKKFPFPQRLFQKQRNFTEEEKLLLLDFHNEILSKVTKEMASLKQLGQIEISCSPLHHPILPLVYDSNSALEAMPRTPLPEPIYNYPEDAKTQIKSGIDYYQKLFGCKPTGMWPSEGSVSNQVLELMAEQNIQWLATDEGILAASLGDNYRSIYKYFPHEINTSKGDVTLFFRDHNLSDKIGFIYSTWNGYDAACNFREELFAIRNNIIHNLGEDALDSAVVPIILDGENCWEFYHENGIHFLRELFSMFEITQELETVLFSECLNLPIPNFLPVVKNIRAGSWINANFSIWVGHQDDVKAWNMLSKVRKLVEENKSKLPAEQLEKIMDEIYIAEGSDWFWWYGPEHDAPNKPDFDVIYRWRIIEIYKMLGLEPPTDLFVPVADEDNKQQITNPTNEIFPTINGTFATFDEWKGAGKVQLNQGNSTMHQIGEVLSNVFVGYNNEYVCFRIELMEFVSSVRTIELNCVSPTNEQIKITHNGSCFAVDSNRNIKMLMAANDCIDIAIDVDYFSRNIRFSLRTILDNNTLQYPVNEMYSLRY